MFYLSGIRGTGGCRIQPPGILGRVYYKLRVLGRYCPLRNSDFGDTVFVPGKVQDVHIQDI